MTTEERIAKEVARQQELAEKRVQKAQQAREEAEQKARAKIQKEEDRLRMVTNSIAKTVGDRPWFDSMDLLMRVAYESNGATKDAYFGDKTPDKHGNPKGFLRFWRAARSPLATEILDSMGVVIFAMGKKGAGVPGRSAVEAYEEQVNAQIKRQIERANERRDRVKRNLGYEIPTVQAMLLTDGSESTQQG